MRAALFYCAALLGADPAFAQEVAAAGAERAEDAAGAAPMAPATTGTLDLETVLRSAQTHFPAVLEAEERRRAAEGRALSAEGGFDTQLSTTGRARASGFYDGRSLGTKLEKPIAPLGATVFGGYRVSGGDFPIYEDYDFTNRGGEVSVGVALSLLRDRDIDERRFRRLDAALGLDAADLDLTLARVRVQHQAMRAYYDWAFARARLEVFKALRDVAAARQTNLAQQVERGARAALVLTENRQNVLRRDILVADAEQALAVAATRLSLYYRDADGQPLTPAPTAEPETVEPPPEATPAALAQSQDALPARPDLQALRVEIARSEARLRLGRNELLPRLDFSYELARDLGPIGEGGASREETDNILSFRLSTPIERRGARGRVQTAQAEMRALELQLQRLTEQISAEIEALRIQLVAAERLAALAKDELIQAQAMQSAETRLFEGGASDFFRLNLREEQTADAEIRRLNAELRRALALTDLYAATLNLPALGL